LEAADKNSLAEILQVMGLFLVSATTEGGAAGDAAAHNELSSEIEKLQPKLTPKQKWLLLSIWLAGVAVGLLRLAFEPPYDPTKTLNEKLYLLNGNMTRADVEKVLGVPVRHGARAGTTQYFVPEFFVIEIPYEQKGPRESPLDHIANKKVARIIR